MVRLIYLLFAICVYSEITAKAPSTPASHDTSVFVPSKSGIPLELQGMFPISMPDYIATEQLLLLSNRWVIVVTYDLPEVVEEISRLIKENKDPDFANFDFSTAQNNFAESVATDKPNWTLLRRYLEPAIKKYYVQARENIGERKLDDPLFFTITSADDPHYTNPLSPRQVARFIIPMGIPKYAGEPFDINYEQYSYLELPYPLEDGKTYTISLGNGKSVVFLYDEMRSVSRAIKVNQVGYLPNGPKIAYIGGYLQNLGPLDLSYVKTFNIVNVHTGEIQYSGPVTLREKNPRFGYDNDPARAPMSGEDLYQLDFSSFEQPGTYFISVPGVGRSWPFKINKNVYGDAFYTQIRGFFQQRCGIGLTDEFTSWTHAPCHTGPTYESEIIQIATGETPPHVDDPTQSYEPFDIIGATLDASKPTIETTKGGWHDAADWDHNISHYHPLFTMLYAYELHPNRFRDNQLHIPESGNGIPDILDEAEFGLLIWKESQLPNGGVSAKWETSTHPGMFDDRYKYAFSRRTRSNSLIYAAAAAQLAYLLKPFDASRAKEWAESATKAYEFGIDPANALINVKIHAKTNRGTGTPYTLSWSENEPSLTPLKISAKTRMYILTKDPDYIKDLPDLIKQIHELSYVLQGDEIWIYAGLFLPEMDQAEKANFKLGHEVERLRKLYINRADELVRFSERDPYRKSKDRNHEGGWAWGHGKTNSRGKWLLFADYLTGGKDPRYKKTAIFNADYELGVNPNGMVWTTGLGFVYPVVFQGGAFDRDWMGARSILDPIPGISIYGPTDSGLRRFNAIWTPTRPDGTSVSFLNPALMNKDSVVIPTSRRYVSSLGYATDMNEYTIYETMADPLFVYSYLMPDDYMPTESMTHQLPRDDKLLFGYWYLP